ncbi:MAG TPA: glycosyltransferase [Nitrososphaeraceae archaeon]|nr:glycosyltransferase [Nitrososphaeraceae archaeon]
MKIEAHIIAWNESDIIAMVIRHYQNFCSHITIWDNYSDDKTQLIAESMGCDVKKFGIKGQLDDQSYLDVKNNCWKGSDADYVIVCDTDEILLWNHPCDWIDGQVKTGATNQKITIWKTYGWNIYSYTMPKFDLLEITTGYHFKNYSKSIMFSPNDIKEINYQPGCHECRPVGTIFYSSDMIPLLHYKQIGGVDRLIARNRLLAKRLSYRNRKMGWGSHYLDSERQIRKEWDERIAKSKPLL